MRMRTLETVRATEIHVGDKLMFRGTLQRVRSIERIEPQTDQGVQSVQFALATCEYTVGATARLQVERAD